MTRASRRVHWVMLGLAGSGVALGAEPGAVPLATAKSLLARTAVPPRFPLSLRGTEHSAGHAIVALTVDRDGRVDDVVTLEASHPAFGSAAEAAVRSWEFEPAEASTRPPRDVRQFEFRSAGVIDTLTHAQASERAFAPAPVRPQVRTVAWNDLPSPPTALASPPPRLAAGALARLAGQPVIVSFIIDTDGAVRVPVVDASVDAEIATAVVQALREWRFAPPRRDGEPVVVQAHRAFGGAENR
jgi:TonB family protein